MVVIFLGLVALCLTHPCNDIDNAELVLRNSMDSRMTETSEYNHQPMLQMADIPQYSLIDSSSAIFENSAESYNENINSVSAQPTKSYADETVTVYDLNSGTRKTLNCFDAVCQIVRNEVGAYYKSGAKAGQTAYHKETIKAHAVAAYTYLKYNMTRGAIPSVGLNPDVPQAVIDCVKEVDGQAIFYNNAYICAVYSASTGGTTLSGKNCWGSNTPYLASVESKYDSLGPQFSFVKVLSVGEVKSLIERNTNIKLSDNPANWFKIASVVDGNYVDSLVIYGNSSCVVRGRERKITGTVFREQIIGHSNLRSPAFTIQYKDGSFYFTSYGYGHGVGLSSEGAEQYVIHEGWDYIQILKHYYTNVTIL